MPSVGGDNIIRVRGYLLNQDGTPAFRQRVVCIPVTAASKPVIQVADANSGQYIALQPISVVPDQTTGYFYADLIATDDPAVVPNFLWAITVGQNAPALVKVPFDTPVIDVDGGLRQAVWLTDLAALTTGISLGPTYYTSTQTDVAITAAITSIPQGPPGSPGPPGPSSGSFTFTQSSPSSSWTVAHNLHRYPNVSYVDDTGFAWLADVEHIDTDTVVLVFPSPTSGKAVCS